jgi:transposase-like protein
LIRIKISRLPENSYGATNCSWKNVPAKGRKAMTAKKSNAKRGHPSSYRPEFVRMAKEIAKLGATDADLARIFGVSDATIDNWKARHPDFLGSLRPARRKRTTVSSVRSTSAPSAIATKQSRSSCQLVEQNPCMPSTPSICRLTSPPASIGQRTACQSVGVINNKLSTHLANTSSLIVL